MPIKRNKTKGCQQLFFGDEIFTGPGLSAIWVLCLLAPSLIAKACNFKPPPVWIFSKFNFKSASMEYSMASLTFRICTFSAALYIHELKSINGGPGLFCCML